MTTNSRNKKKTLSDEIEDIFKIKLSLLQREAIKAIEETNDNIIVSSPTGSGKTIIGYSALLYYKKGFYLAPLISLMMEKYLELSKFLGNKHKVMMSNRDYRIPIKKFLSSDFKILSPYKFLTIFNEINPNKHGNVVVIDEVHKISKDPLFEASITLAKQKNFRIVCLSATISENDLNLLSKWLNAKVIRSNTRPVNLTYKYVKAKMIRGEFMSDTMQIIDGKPILKLGEIFYSREEIASYVASRIYEYTKKPVIVWAPTRNKVEKIAKLIANFIDKKEKYIPISAKLPTSNPSERLLKFTVTHGVFIHHGELSASAREMVEKYYKKYGGIIVTAYTLSHGVNIPGSYLIFSTLYDYKNELIDSTLFHQISGRAGRPNLDESGTVIAILIDDAEESFYNNVLLKTKATEIIANLLQSSYDLIKMLLPIVSRYNIDNAISLVRETYSYLKYPNEKKINEIKGILKKTIDYYNRFGYEGKIAMDMGLHPLEYEIIKTAMKENKYYDVLDKIIDIASYIHGIDSDHVAYDITKYGYLAYRFGNPEAREVANTIQIVLESGIYFASRVYGWKSNEREHMVELAKKFAYAGNPLVEPLSKEIKIDALRRMIKTAPQIISGASGEEAYNATIVAVKEAFFFWKNINPKRIKKITDLVWYALTGEKEAPDIIVKTIIKEVTRNDM